MLSGRRSVEYLDYEVILKIFNSFKFDEDALSKI